MTEEQNRQVDAEIAKLIAETGKLIAETGKLNADIAKIRAEARFYPLVMLLGGLGGMAALTTAILGVIRVLG